MVFFYTSAPSAPPTNVTASATSSTSIRVNWSSVKKSERNGNITHYEIELSALNETKSVSVSFRERSMEVLELKEFTVYSVSMRAFTVIGPSPYSTPITVTTLEDGECVLGDASSAKCQHSNLHSYCLCLSCSAIITSTVSQSYCLITHNHTSVMATCVS